MTLSFTLALSVSSCVVVCAVVCVCRSEVRRSKLRAARVCAFVWPAIPTNCSVTAATPRSMNTWDQACFKSIPKCGPNLKSFVMPSRSLSSVLGL